MLDAEEVCMRVCVLRGVPAYGGVVGSVTFMMTMVMAMAYGLPVPSIVRL